MVEKLAGLSTFHQSQPCHLTHLRHCHVLILASAINLAGLRLYFAAVIAQINGELLKMGMLEHLGGLKAELEAEMVPAP